MKKVLHIFSEINYSGAELMWYSAIDILREEGYEIILLSTGKTKGNFSYAFEEKGIQVYHLPIKNIFLFLFSIFRLFLKIKPDIVHIHPEYKHLYFYYILFSKLVKAKSIRTIHSMQKSRFRYYGMVIRKLSKLLGCKFVSISEDVRKNELVLYKNNTLSINNWVNENRFKPLRSDKEKKILRSKLNLPIDKVLLLSVGSCYYIKNHQLILNTMPLLDDKYVYIHIGIGEDELNEKELAKNLGIENRVYFLGTKSNVEEYLQCCDVFVMPSLYEGVGIAAIEAIMNGLNTFKKYKPLVQYIDNNELSLKDTILNFDDIDIFIKKEIRNKIVTKYGINQNIRQYIKLYENENL